MSLQFPLCLFYFIHSFTLGFLKLFSQNKNEIKIFLSNEKIVDFSPIDMKL